MFHDVSRIHHLKGAFGCFWMLLMVLVSSALNVMRGIPAKHWSARMFWWQGPATFGTGFNHRSSLGKQVSLSGWQPADGVEVTPSHLHILLMFFYGFFILHVVCSIWPRTVLIALCCPLFRQNCCWNMPSGNHRKASWYAQIISDYHRLPNRGNCVTLPAGS